MTLKKACICHVDRLQMVLELTVKITLIIAQLHQKVGYTVAVQTDIGR